MWRLGSNFCIVSDYCVIRVFGVCTLVVVGFGGVFFCGCLVFKEGMFF